MIDLLDFNVKYEESFTLVSYYWKRTRTGILTVLALFDN